MIGKLSCVYVTDGGFLPCTCFSIKTLVQNSSIPLQIFVLCVDIDPNAISKANRYLRSIGAAANFIHISDAEFVGLPQPKSLPRAVYGRLSMHRLLPADLDRVLYLDGDTLVDIDVAPLATVPLEGAVVGAVLDIGRVLIGRREEAQLRLELGPDGDYFNAGVLLIDWQKWVGAEVGERCLRALTEDPDRFTQKDQCVLNFICRGQWKHLGLEWNYQPACVVHEGRADALFHFLGGRKPWCSDSSRHPTHFAKRYAEMYQNSPWSGEYKSVRALYFILDWFRLGNRILSPRYWKNVGRYKQAVNGYRHR